MSDQTLHITGLSETGRVRDHNEDCIAVRPDLGLAVLADGMGGHRAGEVASSLAVQAVVDEFERALAESPLASGLDDDGTEAVYLTLNTVAQANTLVYQSAQQSTERTGMGTTLVLALFAPGSVTIAHVGDSRAYRLRESNLERLTQDHSMFEEAVRKGMFTPEQAQRSFGKNIITRALGVAPDVDIDVQQFALLSGDVFLLCSDGLSDLVGDVDMQAVLHEFGANHAHAVQHLIELANARGGHDNISVVLAQYQPPRTESARPG
ncbi:MAG: Stp1/IreP family PP2C-type Ser/Thr phosphatase [Gammaproteobacteria bacterium]|nr:Stp1/IreP family PP2C-type Ser/Thr phosphatase [Gammaproteobacteria bacterium]